MPRNRFYRRSPDAALLGMFGLNHEQRSVYGALIDMAYDRGGPIDDSDPGVVKLSGCRYRVAYDRVIAQLEAIGKVRRRDDKLLEVRGFDAAAIGEINEALTSPGKFEANSRQIPPVESPSNLVRISVESPSNLPGEVNKILSENEIPLKSQDIFPSRAHTHARGDACARATAASLAFLNPNQAKQAAVLVAEAMGVSLTTDTHRLNWPAQVAKLIDAGLDLQLDILPAVRTVRERRAAKGQGHDLAHVKTLSYFAAFAREIHDARVGAAEARTAQADAPVEQTDDAGWHRRFIAWLRLGLWPLANGPMPRSGRCAAPHAILDRALAAWTEQGGHPVEAFCLATDRFMPWARVVERRPPAEGIDHGGPEGL